MTHRIDKIDKMILSLLQENARTPLKHLAAKVFLSSPAVSSRIERLEKRGILTGYHASVNPEAFGYRIQAFINLSLIPKEKSCFLEFIENCNHVTECHCITGHCSMLMKVIFRSTEELDVFVDQLQQFGETETQIIFSTPIEPRGIQTIKKEEYDEPLHCATL